MCIEKQHNERNDLLFQTIGEKDMAGAMQISSNSIHF
jgi:hypothetical protein